VGFKLILLRMESKLQTVSKLPNDTRYKAYETFADEVLDSKNVEHIAVLMKHLIHVEGKDQHGRTYITPEILVYIIKKIRANSEEEDESKVLDFDQLLQMFEQIVPVIREKGEDFPNALLEAVDVLSKMYEGEQDWKKAAFCMSSFKFEQYRHLSCSADRKVEWYVNTAETWLEAEESGMASQSVKKAHVLMNQVQDQDLALRFKTCYARVLDSERKFLEAAVHYKKLSQMGQGVISEADMLQTLQNAVTCAILAKAGPSRARVLAMLYSDERSATLPNFLMLEKMFKDRIVREDEVKQFQSTLAEHQNASQANGMTVLQNSVCEHNLLACSKLYKNIKFQELGTLLNISAKDAEKLASDMIEQGRMQAMVDQIEEQLEFTSSSSGTLQSWDAKIQDLCLSVNHAVEAINRKHPEYIV